MTLLYDPETGDSKGPGLWIMFMHELAMILGGWTGPRGR